MSVSKRPFERARRLLAAALLLCSAAACQTVEPWERGTLAKRSMALDNDPLKKSLREQVFFSKEGSSGGISAAGGGCGCN